MLAETRGDPAHTSRLWLRLTIAICLVVLIATFAILRGRDAVENPDEAAYAEQAESLLHDGSLTVGYVRYFHHRYEPGIDHPEDFYPPGNGVLIAGAWSLFGRSDAASAVPSAVMACLLLPLLVFVLGLRFGATPPFAFVAAMSVLFDLAVRDHAFEAMADLPLTTATTAALLAAMRPGLRAAALSALFLGVGFWLKPTALLFVPGLVLALLIAERQSRRVLLSRALLFGGVFLAACLPWLLRNHALFGSFLYSGNMHLSAAANDPSFVYSDIRRVYWTNPGLPLPGLGSSLVAHGFAPVVKRFLQHIYEIVATHGASAFGGVFALALLSLWRRRHTLAAICFTVSYLLALSAVFAIFYRYLLPIFPIVIALNWSFIDAVVRRMGQSDFGSLLERHIATPGRTALLLAAIVAIPGGSELARDLVGGREFISMPDVPLHESARWSRDHLPEDATVMVQEALVFRHVSSLKTVDTPFDRPDQIEAVVDHYGVDYLVTMEGGQFAELSTQFVFPYLEKYRDQWRRVDPEGQRFSIWVRRGAPDPR